MFLYKVDNGTLSTAPQSKILDDGTTILNFDLVAEQYGYKELIQEPQPSYNEKYQTLHPIYEEQESCIIKKWEVINSLPLDQYKNIKINELDDVYHQALLDGFQSLGYTFAYDEEAQKNFTKVTALFGLKPEKIDTPWNTLSHGIILLTKEQYLQVVEDAENHEWFNLGKLWDCRHKVDIAQSYEEVTAVTWE